MTQDPNGNVLVTGQSTRSNDEVAKTPFIAKLSPAGEELWLQSPFRGYASISELVADRDGNVFLTGAGLYLPKEITTPRSGDAFVMKLSAAGEVLWTTYVGGSGEDAGTSIAIDPDGYVILGGGTGSPDLSGALNGPIDGDDGFVAKLSTDGKLIWSRYLGSTNGDLGAKIALDERGNVVAAVAEEDYSQAEGRARGASLAKVGSDGELQWSAQIIGGVFLAVALDSFGNTYLSAYDGLITKLDPQGILLWQTRIEGMGFGGVADIAVNGYGDVQAVGVTNSPDLPGAVNSLFDPEQWADGFVTRLNADGAILWSYYLGTSGHDSLSRIVFSGDGAAYLVGTTSSPQFPSKINEFRGSSSDLFVAKLNFGTGEAHPPASAVQQSTTLGTLGDDVIRVSAAIVDSVPAVIVTINGIAGTPFIPTAPIKIRGLGGNDTITVDPGVVFPVILYGDEGDDTLTGGSGVDLIYGGVGQDVITGGAGNDTLYGNLGSDTIMAGSGDDQVFGGIGRDVITGGAGNDTLLGGNGTDDLRSGAGHDRLEGKGKADTLYGGDGNDTIISGAGADLIFGDEGDDVLDANPHALFRDELRGGPGHDRYMADEDDLLLDVEEPLLV